MLVTDGGQLIRCPVEGIRIAGRGTQGVIVFDTAEDEKVVSVERITDDGVEDGVEGGPDDEAGDDAPGAMRVRQGGLLQSPEALMKAAGHVWRPCRSGLGSRNLKKAAANAHAIVARANLSAARI